MDPFVFKTTSRKFDWKISDMVKIHVGTQRHVYSHVDDDFNRWVVTKNGQTYTVGRVVGYEWPIALNSLEEVINCINTFYEPGWP